MEVVMIFMALIMVAMVIAMAIAIVVLVLIGVVMVVTDMVDLATVTDMVALVTVTDMVALATDMVDLANMDLMDKCTEVVAVISKQATVQITMQDSTMAIHSERTMNLNRFHMAIIPMINYRNYTR